RVEWDGSKEIFHFAPGQNHYPKIARDHRHLMPVERDPVFLHTNPWGGFRQLDYDEYFDKFNETTYQLGKRFKEG
ncbi:MAG: hypothetical protein GWN58_01725, partial [Anaerolineae bacterium]|nr:hypothetical protein [Anaerolineae bacterium]